MLHIQAYVYPHAHPQTCPLQLLHLVHVCIVYMTCI